MQRRARAVRLFALLACVAAGLAARAEAPKAGAAAPAAAPAAAKPAAPMPGDALEGVTATILDVKPQRLLVLRSGTATNPAAPRVLSFMVSSQVPVAGSGRTGWADLKQGDPVLVSYLPGDPPQLRKVTVLARQVPIDKLLMAEVGFPSTSPPPAPSSATSRRSTAT
jgi:hypothetical protein